MKSLPKYIHNHSTYGILLMSAAVALIAVMNMFSKLISDDYDPVEKVFYRGVVALVFVVGVMIIFKKTHAFRTRRPLMHIGRGTIGSVGLGLVYWAYSLMPMTDVAALMFTAGFMTLIASAVILKEHVGPYRIGAVGLGFIGALIIARPNAEDFNMWGVVAALSAAFVGGALVAVFLRSLGKTESAYTTVFYFLLIGTIGSAPYVFAYGSWIRPDTVFPILGMGLSGGVSLLLKTEAYRHAEASLLTPVHYTAIIWAVLFDISIWGVFPPVTTLLGAGIIIAANVIILRRERIKRY